MWLLLPNTTIAMPVQLPLAPARLLTQPQDPPTPTDIANAIAYNKNIQIGCGKSVLRLSIFISIFLFSLL